MRLTGVGVGPGDPELVTSRRSGCCASRRRRAGAGAGRRPSGRRPGRGDRPRLRRRRTGCAGSPFALNDRGGVTARREAAWDAAARAVVAAFDARCRGRSRSPPSATRTSTPPSPTWPRPSRELRAGRCAVQTVPGDHRHAGPGRRAAATVLAEGTEPLTLLPVTAGLGGWSPTRWPGPAPSSPTRAGAGPAALRRRRCAGTAGSTTRCSARGLGLPDESDRAGRELADDAAAVPVDLLVPARRGRRGGEAVTPARSGSSGPGPARPTCSPCAPPG